MKNIYLIIVFSFVLLFGCARVSLQAPKEPIKVDISMRLDVYQHVVKDIDDIESIVSGSKDQSKLKDKPGPLDYFIASVYAQDLDPEIKQAALRRRDRHAELASLEQTGAVGEDRSGLLKIRDGKELASAAQNLVSAENKDRMVIYGEIAKKNGTSVASVQEIYAKRLQQDAPQGTPIEVFNQQSGKYEWQEKR